MRNAIEYNIQINCPLRQHRLPQGVLSAAKPTLHTQDISHGLGSFLLCRGGDVGIGIQGESCGEVAQHAGHRLDIYSVLQRNGCEGVAESMESDLQDASFF